MRFPSIYLLGLIATLCLSRSAIAERASSAFDSENNEVEHLGEDISGASAESPKTKYVRNENDALDFNEFANEYDEELAFLENEINFDENGDIVFVPEGLIYHDCPLSITATREFEITNKMNNPVTIFTVRSSNRQFHSTLSKNQEIAGGGKLKVNILYLPHQVEFLTADLTFVTSRGEYVMPISANSINNPYKIQPQLGIRFPPSTNVIERPIVVYNPHPETLHITEVFTTENFLFLKGAAFQGVGSDPNAPASDKIRPRTEDKAEGQRVVPDNSTAHPTAGHTLWSIPPGTEKEIITLSLSNDLPPGPHSGFLHIKTDHKNLVMPIEINVLNTLVYPQFEELTFGLFSSPTDKRKTLDLWMNNEGPQNVEVTEIILVEPDANLQIEMVRLPIIFAGSSFSSRVARVHYSGTHPGLISNKLLVITNNSNAASAVVEVRYSAQVLHGGIASSLSPQVFRIEVYNQTYPFECLQCDAHGSRLGYNDDLYSALLDDYYQKQNLAQQQQGGQTSHHHSHPQHAHIHTHEHVYDDNLAEQPAHVQTQTITIRNQYDAAVHLRSVVFSNCEEFLFSDFVPPTTLDILHNSPQNPVVVHKNEAWKPIKVTLKSALMYALYRENFDFLPKVCHMDITTNISATRMPVFVVTGALSIEFMDMPMIEDFGSANITSLRPAPEPPASSGSSSDGASAPCSSPGGQDSGDLEVQFNAEGGHWQCDSPLCQSVNSDIFHVDLGNQSIAEPRVLRIVLVNPNPVSVPVQFAHASHDACVCSESIWPAGENTIEYVEPKLSRAHPVTWASAVEGAKDGPGCLCLEPSAEEDEEEDKEVVENDESFRAEFTKQYQAGRRTLTPREMKRTGPITFGNEPAYSHVFAIAIRNLSSCRVHPAVLKGFTNVAMSECRSGVGTTLLPGSAKLAPKLKNGDRSSVRVDFLTEHQRLQVHLHFTARVARFRTAIAPPNVDRSQGGTFVLGQGAPLVLRSRSSFSEPLRDFQYFVEPNNIYRIEYESALNTNPGMKTWHTGVYLTKICVDRSNLLLHDRSQLTLTGPSIEDESLKGMTLFRCSHRLLSNMNYTEAEGPLISLLRRMDGYMQKVTQISPKVAFNTALKVKQTWAQAFAPGGLRVPQLVLSLLSPHTSHTFRLDNITLQIPNAYAPHSYSVRLPTIRVGQVQWFYLNVHNPYDVTLSFTLLEDAASETAKRMKALGGLFFQALELETTLNVNTAVRAFSRYQCLGPEVGEIQRLNSPIPCECNVPSSGQLNSSFCEMDHAATPKHADEGLLHRSRSLSLVRSAVAYSHSSSVLAGLDKLFSPESEAKYSSPDSSKLPPSEMPFLPQSTIESAFVVPPRSNGRVGPFLYAPQTHRTPGSKAAHYDVPHSFYMFNNFTGFDRVDLYTSSGSASLSLIGWGHCLKNASATPENTGLLTSPDNGVSCGEGFAEIQQLMPATSHAAIRVEFNKVGQYNHFYVQNTGDVAATVYNAVLDDFACAYSPPEKPEEGLWARLKAFFLPPKKIVGDPELAEINSICARLPMNLLPNTTTSMWIRAPLSCDYASQRRVLVLSLDKTPITAQSEHDPSNHLTIQFDFEMSPEVAPICAQLATNTTYPLIKLISGAALLYGVWQMLSVWLLSRYQREKYLSAKQTKARRVRTPSKRPPGTPSHTAGSPAVGSPPLGGPTKEPTEPRSVIPESRGVIDLSDVLLEEGGAGGAESAAYSRDRERESLGSEPAGEWTVVRPKLRAVEALRQSRAHAPPSNGSPVKAHSAISTPASSPSKQSFQAPSAFQTSPLASPEKPLASPLKGPLQGPPSPSSLPPINGMPGQISSAESSDVAIEPQIQSKPPGLTSPAAVSPRPKQGTKSDLSVQVDEDSQSSVAPPAPLSNTSSEGFESRPSEVSVVSVVSGVSSPPPALEQAEETADVKVEDVVSPITPATPATVTPIAPATTAASVPTNIAETVEVKEKSRRQLQREAKEKKERTKALKEAAVTSVAPATATSPVEVTVDSTRDSDLSDAVPLPAVPAPVESSKTAKTRAEKTAKKGTKAIAVEEVKAPASGAAAPTVTATSTAGTTVTTAASKMTKTSKASQPLTEKQLASEVVPKTAAVPSNTSKPPLATRGKLSPLRLQQPTGTFESNPAEDSPLFRYSGQLLDPSRDSNAELSALSDYPTPARGSLAPFPALGAAQIALGTESELSGSDKSALLSHSLPADLWPATAEHDPVASLSLDLGLDLDLNLDDLGHLDLNYAPLASPDNILRTGAESDLRVGADPFFARTFEPRNKPSGVTSTSSALRDRTSSASNYLNDLLNSAPGAFGENDDFSFGGSSRSGKSGTRDWWPSGAQPTEALHSSGRTHSQPDSFFDLSSGSGGRNYGNSSPPGQWASADLGQSAGRRGPGFSPQHPEPGMYSAAPGQSQRYQPPQRSPHEDMYAPQQPPLSYGGHQGDSFYRAAQAGIYNEPQELSRPVFDRTDRGGRESDHARYHGPAAQPGFEGSLLHSRSPPQMRHKELAPQGPSRHLQGQMQGQPAPRQFAYEAHEQMHSHSYDYLDLDRALDESANNWISDLTRPGEMEHASMQGRRQIQPSGGPPNGPFGYAPEPAFGGYGRSEGPQRGAPMHQQQIPQQQQHRHPQHQPLQQQQQYRPQEQQRGGRAQGVSPGGLVQQAPYTAPTTRYVPPPQADLQGLGGFADPFSRPEPVTYPSTSPGRDTESARWLALNASAQQRGNGNGDGRMRPQQAQLQQGPPGMQHMRPSGAPLAGYAPHAGQTVQLAQPSRSPNTHAHLSPYNAPPTSQLAQLSQLQTRDPRELAAMQPFGRDMATVAQEMNFFAPQSFFGDAATGLVSDVALEALESEDDTF